MYALMLAILCFQPFARAVDDPDRVRKVPEGQEVYTGPDVRVGGVYEAFIIRFKDRQAPLLSPSRFKVAYEEGTLQCRNADAFSIGDDATGAWHKISFEILSVKESAIEDPPGSGNWGWARTIDCDIKSLLIVE
mgnify:CR=1 FL=1